MFPSFEAIRKVLDKLVTPKYPKIIDYDVEIEMDENNSLITVVVVYFEPDGYWETFRNDGHDYVQGFEAEIEDSVVSALKYLGLDRRVYATIYIIGEDDSDAGN